MTDSSLEQRIAKLEAIEAIRQLKHVYMNYCDIGYPPDKLGPLFTEDAVWDGGEFGRHEGRKAIEAFFDAVSADIVFAAHLALNEIIEVEGDWATGKWRILMPCTMMTDGQKEGRWILGDYVEEYARQDGRWLFKSIDFFVNFNVPHAEGWAATGVIRP